MIYRTIASRLVAAAFLLAGLTAPTWSHAQPLDFPMLPGSDSCSYTGPLTVGVQGRYLTVNSRPTHVTFVSYFDIMDVTIPNLRSDLSHLRRRGITGIRVFPNWWNWQWTSGQRTGQSITYASNTLMDMYGSVNPTALSHVQAVLNEARKCGMVVDVSFSAETLGPAGTAPVDLRSCTPPISYTAYRTALGTVTGHLVPYRNAIFDVQNESNVVGVFRSDCSGDHKPVDLGKISGVVSHIKAIDPLRLVTTATGNVTHAATIPLDIASYHDERPDNWWKQTTAEVQYAVGLTTKPVYMQEPNYYSQEKSSNNVFGGKEIKSAMMRAHLAGAAAYTFHNESSFQMNGTTLQALLWQEEKNALQLMRQINAQGLGSNALGDFNGDGLDDIADFTMNPGAPGQFYIRLNLGGGAFQSPPTNSGHGQASTLSSQYFKPLVGDFNNDGRADFADFRTDTGEFWIHYNLGGTYVTFDTGTSMYGWLPASVVGAEWEHLVGDVNGDGFDDIVSHNLRTGAVNTHLNPTSGWVQWGIIPSAVNAAVNTACAPGTPPNASYCASGSTGVNTEWRLLVADFTGDGKADFADFQVTGEWSGWMWVHAGTAGNNFSGAVTAHQFPSLNVSLGGGAPYAPPYIAIPAYINGDSFADILYVDRGAGSFFNFVQAGGTYSGPPYGPGNAFTAGDSWAPLGQPIRMIP